MSSKNLLQLTLESPAADALMYFVKDPGGTPLDRACTLADLASVLSPVIPANEIVFGTGTGVTSSSGFTFDPATGAGGEGILTLSPSTTANDNYPRLFEIIKTSITAAAMQTAAALVGGNINLQSADAAVAELDGLSVSISSASTVSGSSSAAINANAVFTGNDATSSITAVNISASKTGMGSLATATGLNVNDVTGATNNYAIKTGAGDIVFGDLAGFGSAVVYTGNNGKLAGDSGFTFDPTTLDTTSVTITRTLADTSFSNGLRVTVNASDGVLEADAAALLVHQPNGADVGGLVGMYLQATSINAADTAGYATGLYLEVSPSIVTNDAVGIDIYGISPVSAAKAIGLRIASITAGIINQAIVTGASGDIVFGALAGIGTRPVVVDANGKLSAP